jgi:hypothetical protein
MIKSDLFRFLTKINHVFIRIKKTASKVMKAVFNIKEARDTRYPLVDYQFLIPDCICCS